MAIFVDIESPLPGDKSGPALGVTIYYDGSFIYPTSIASEAREGGEVKILTLDNGGNLVCGLYRDNAPPPSNDPYMIISKRLDKGVSSSGYWSFNFSSVDPGNDYILRAEFSVYTNPQQTASIIATDTVEDVDVATSAGGILATDL